MSNDTNTTKVELPEPVLGPYFDPVYFLTGAFGAVFIMGFIFVPRGPNAAVIKTCITMSAFCMWIFWVTVYIGQMNPVLGPKLENTTLAWISRKWGLPMLNETKAPLPHVPDMPAEPAEPAELA